MTSVFAGVDDSSPLPANAACAYHALLFSVLQAGQGKRTVDAIIETRQPQSVVIQLVAAYV